MPLYEYLCDNCGDRFEVMQKFADEPLKIHEKCGGSVHRLLSAPALQFKGSGWYINDYAKSGSSSNSDSSSRNSTNTNAKPDTSSSTPSTPANSSSNSSTESKK